MISAIFKVAEHEILSHKIDIVKLNFMSTQSTFPAKHLDKNNFPRHYKDALSFKHKDIIVIEEKKLHQMPWFRPISKTIVEK